MPTITRDGWKNILWRATVSQRGQYRATPRDCTPSRTAGVTQYILLMRPRNDFPDNLMAPMASTSVRPHVTIPTVHANSAGKSFYFQNPSRNAPFPPMEAHMVCECISFRARERVSHSVGCSTCPLNNECVD